MISRPKPNCFALKDIFAILAHSIMPNSVTVSTSNKQGGTIREHYLVVNIHWFKDTIKAFEDFKNKQQECIK